MSAGFTTVIAPLLFANHSHRGTIATMQSVPYAVDVPVYARLPLVYRLAAIGLDLVFLSASLLLWDENLWPFLLTYPVLVFGMVVTLALIRREPVKKRLLYCVDLLAARIGPLCFCLWLIVAILFKSWILLLIVAAVLGTMLWFSSGRRVRLRKGCTGSLAQDQALRQFAAEFGIYDLKLLSTHDVDMPNAAALYNYGPPAEFIINPALMAALSPSEQRVVFCHELAHHRLHHSVLSRWARLLYDGIVVASLIFWGLFVYYQGRHDSMYNFPVVFLLTYFTAIAVHPLYLWYMRLQERQANIMALRMTNDPAAFESAMVKVAKALQLPAGRAPWWTQWFFATHPTLDETLNQARTFVRA